MKTYQFGERTILCGHAGQWEELVRAGNDAEMGTVIDLRTFLEIGEQQVPKPPEGWGYRRLPVTGATVSEQDLDVFRREFYRKPRTVVIGPNEDRGQLVVAASVARFEQKAWDHSKRAEGVGEGERDLLNWLTSYLVRHGCEPASSLEGMVAGTPAAKGKAAPKRTTAGEQPGGSKARETVVAGVTDSKPMAQDASVPISEPVSVSEAERVSQSVPISEAERVSEPVPTSEAERVSEPVPISEAERVSQSVPISEAERVSQSVLDSSAGSEAVPLSESAAEPSPLPDSRVVVPPIEETPSVSTEGEPLPTQGEQLENLAGVSPREQIEALYATEAAGVQKQTTSASKPTKKAKSKPSSKAKNPKRK